MSTIVHPYTETFINRRISQNDGAAPVTVTAVEYVTLGKSRTGGSMPHYKSLIKQGLQAGTNLSAYKTSCEGKIVLSPSMTMSKRGGTFPNFFYYQPISYTFIGTAPQVGNPKVPNHLAVSSQTVDNRALIQTRRAVKSQQQAMSGFTFLGELRETIHMLRNPLEALRKGMTSYHDRLLKEKKRVKGKSKAEKQRNLVDAASGTWLEVSFGVKPLLNDVKDIAETIARFVSDDSRRARVRGYASEINVLDERLESNLAGNIYAKEVSRTTTTRTIVYRVGLKTDDSLPPIGSIGRLGELSGFNLDDFVPSVYQLIPYSFLLDYFTNAGDVLEAACTSTSAVSWIVKSEILETTRKTDIFPFIKTPLPAEYFVTSSDRIDQVGGHVLSRKDVSRTLPSDLAIPTFEFSFDGDNLGRWVNMAALLVQRDKQLLRF